MKKIITFVLFIVNSLLFAQQKIDIQLTEATSDCYELALIPSITQNTVLSSLVFTLKWSDTYSLFIGNGSTNQGLYINKVGIQHNFGGYNYQTYEYTGLQSVNISDVKIIIPKIGNGNIEIVDKDEFTYNLNGSYYISTGGLDVTGEVIYSAVVDYIKHPSIKTLYYDPNSNQFVIKKENRYVTILGQNITPVNLNDLRKVYKNEN